MRYATVLWPLAVLATAAAAQSDTRPYRALGTEPFWNLTIGTSTMRLERLGERPLTVRRPAARASFNGDRYVTRRLTVDVTHVPCSDGMSDRRYRDTVIVHLGSATLRGCGNAIRPRRDPR